MTICRPESPAFASGAEREVWTRLRAQLGSGDLLLANVRITDRTKDHEADVVVALPGAGIVAVEVKGGSVWRTGDQWWQSSPDGDKRIDPVEQAIGCHYAIRAYVETDPRWRTASARRVRWAHAVALPATTLPTDFATPSLPRWAVLDRSQLDSLADDVRAIATDQDTSYPAPTEADVQLIAEILAGRGLPQRDVVAIAAQRESDAQRLTAEQSVLLGATQLLTRVEIRGGAGSGKTWLAVEQARRLTQAGQRVALLCYSRGLAEFLRRQTEHLTRRQRPAYVGEFHSLGHQWGAQPGTDDDSDYWERRLPEQMVVLADALPVGQKFDSVVIDEAQDFADAWWPAILASLKDPDEGGVYVFSDEGQRVFVRYGRPSVPLVPLVLDHNLRNTRQIAETFNPLCQMRMRLLGGDGPRVQFIPCPPDEAVNVADDQIDALLDDWRPQDVALLTTGARHPEQVERQSGGQKQYWESFWDTKQVFYGHVLGFKGLERPVVVLAANESRVSERSRERLYVGLSRARDLLVVCGDPEQIREIAGDEVLRRLLRDAQPRPGGGSY